MQYYLHFIDGKWLPEIEREAAVHKIRRKIVSQE